MPWWVGIVPFWICISICIWFILLVTGNSFNLSSGHEGIITSCNMRHLSVVSRMTRGLLGKKRPTWEARGKEIIAALWERDARVLHVKYN